MFKSFLAYSASAGTGKTFALSIRYISLLFLGESPNSILAATFTKKAANEMRERVLSFLENLDRDENLLNIVANQTNLSKEEILSKKSRVLNRFLKERNHIITLDSFFNMILRSFALQMGLDSSFLIKDSVHLNSSENLIKELNSSGKLDLLVDLSLILNKKRVSDLETLFLNLFNLDAILPEVSYKIVNLEAIKREIFAKRDELLNILISIKSTPREQKLFNEDDIKKLVTKAVFERAALSEHPWFKKSYQKEPEIDRYFLELKALIKKYLLALEEATLSYLFDIYNSYKSVRIAECKAKSELDFNDILYFCYRLIAHKVSRDFIYFKLDSKFKHILLDEFQDTSSLQYLILEPLIEEIFSGFGTSEFRSFFYVGDKKQSLYRFRGGVEELFDYVANRFEIDVENLDINYRSAKNIVDFTNRVFLNSGIKDYVLQKANSDIKGYVEVLESANLLEKAKERVEFYLSKGADINDIAILVFTNKDGTILQDYLKEHKIDSILKTSSSLKYNPKIAALVGVLKFLITKEKIHLAPFLAKIKKDEIDLKDFENEIDPFKILDKIISTYGYFDSDENILKLLDFAKDFNTINEFLDEFDKSNIPLAKESVNGLSIMTIHGSKGLEFKYVILLDRFGNTLNRGDLLLFENENPVKIKKIHTRFSKKENFIENYAKALEKEKSLEEKDKLNLLYVAITRAELALSIIKKDKRSEFDILSLQEEKIGSVEIVKKPKREEIEKLNIKISSYGKQEFIESKNEDELEGRDFDKIYFGEALHYALELISFAKPNFDFIKNALKNRYGEILNENSIDDILNRVKILFKNEKFKNIIKNAKIFKEQPISYGGEFYQLDLLVKKENLNIIIDYKSSKNFRYKHINQVKNYKNAIKDIGRKEVEAYILYLLNDEIEFFEV